LAGISQFEESGRRLNAALKQRLAGSIDSKTADIVNRGMMQVERNWLNPDGIPGRHWFKHMLYGARYTYAHLELPGLTEAVEKQDWTTAQEQANLLTRALEKNARLLEELRSELARDGDRDLK